MHYNIQKPGILRRISAGIFDAILLMVLVCGIAWGVSAIMNVDAQINAVNAGIDQYEKEHNIDFSLTEEEMATMPSEEQVRYDKEMELMFQDDSIYFAFIQVLNSFLVTISISVLIGHVLLEFLVPVLLKNGQTFGKKIFGIALMRKDGITVTNFAMFARSILGKCTIEVMIPILIIFLMFLGAAASIGPILLLALVVVQLGLLLFHPQNAMLHDLLACTVAVDMSSQLIFTSTEAMLDYQKQRAAEKAEQADY